MVITKRSGMQSQIRQGLSSALQRITTTKGSVTQSQVQQWIAPELWDDADAAFALVDADTHLIRYVSKRLLSDQAFVVRCASEHPHVVLYADESLKSSAKVFEAVVKGNPNYMEYFSAALRDNLALCRPVIQGVCGPRIYKDCGPTVRSDVSLAMDVVRREAHRYVYCEGAAKHDWVVCLTAVKNFEPMVGYVPLEIKIRIDRAASAHDGRYDVTASWLLAQHVSELEKQQLEQRLDVSGQEGEKVKFPRL